MRRQPNPREQAIVQDVHRFRELTSSQVLRLHFELTLDGRPSKESGRQSNLSRTMARLHDQQRLGRLDRAIGGHFRGSDGYTYVKPASTARQPTPHTHDIAELYVQLMQAQRAGLISSLTYQPEAWAYEEVSGVQLKPDAFISFIRAGKTNPRTYFLEVDRSSEEAADLRVKMRRYVKAADNFLRDANETGKPARFPVSLWTVQTPNRLQELEREAAKLARPNLFRVELFERAVGVIIS